MGKGYACEGSTAPSMDWLSSAGECDAIPTRNNIYYTNGSGNLSNNLFTVRSQEEIEANDLGWVGRKIIVDNIKFHENTSNI